MEIQILGTAAAEGWPALFCSCSPCAKARSLGGKNYRTRSSLQINDDLKIDFPPDSLVHAHRYGLDYAALKYLLFTHAHFDHLAAKELTYLIPPFALQDKTESIKIYGTDECINLLLDPEKHIEKGRPGLLNRITYFQELTLEPYEVTALKADHGTEGQSLNYLISHGGKTLLYACDTGFYEEDTWKYLQGARVDLVIAECTGGPDAVEYKHLGFPDVQRLRRNAEELGITDEATQWVLTHFSHVGAMLHEELQDMVSPHGYTIAWDGMKLHL